MQYIEKSIVLSGASTYQACIYVHVLVLVLGHFHSIWIHTDEEDRMLWSLGKESIDALVSGLFTRFERQATWISPGKLFGKLKS